VVETFRPGIILVITQQQQQQQQQQFVSKGVFTKKSRSIDILSRQNKI
jgi:hypothetical protein